MDKRALIDQLADRIAATARAALGASEAASTEAKEGATPADKRDDARAAVELATLGRAQDRRARQALAELDALRTFRPPTARPGAAVTLGALVEIEDVDSGEGRTFFLAPVGAGVSLTGPDGDGFLSVVTPASPIGRAVTGKRVGDEVEVVVDGVSRVWTLTWIG